MPRHILSVSGGKDSTAMYCLAIERGIAFQAVFADTGNEATTTYDYIKALPQSTGGPPIKWVRADFTERIKTRRANLKDRWEADGISSAKIDHALAVIHPTGNPFKDLTLLKGRFPSTKIRFCTVELKIDPIRNQVYQPVWDAGLGVISWQGVRGEESVPRSRLTKFQKLHSPSGKLVVYRPLLRWSLDDVRAMHKRHNIKPNPLYAQGFKRVGCFPCIMSRKAEVRRIAQTYPEHIDRIRQWEAKVSEASKRGCSTFFPVAGRAGTPIEDIHHSTHGIDDVVNWSKTSHGGRQVMIPMDDPQMEFGTACNEWGVCE